MKALEKYKVSKDCVLVYINLYKYSHRNKWLWFFVHWFVCFPQIKAEHNVFFQVGFEWGSTSRIDKENDRGKEQWNFISLASGSTEMLLQHSLFLPFRSQLIRNYSVTTSGWNLTHSLYFRICNFIFLNSIPTLRSLQTWRKCICIWKS